MNDASLDQYVRRELRVLNAGRDSRGDVVQSERTMPLFAPKPIVGRCRDGDERSRLVPGGGQLPQCTGPERPRGIGIFQEVECLRGQRIERCRELTLAQSIEFLTRSL